LPQGHAPHPQDRPLQGEDQAHGPPRGPHGPEEGDLRGLLHHLEEEEVGHPKGGHGHDEEDQKAKDLPLQGKLLQEGALGVLPGLGEEAASRQGPPHLPGPPGVL